MSAVTHSSAFLSAKARVAPGTVLGVAETALCIEMECDVLLIE